MAALQQQQLHQQIMQQQLLGVTQQPGAGVPGLAGTIADTAAITLDRKQREVYVGNLAIGAIDRKLIEEFFNQALSHMVSDPVTGPPVINVNMDSQGRFAFVEFRARELANQALLMDKLVEVYGRHLHIGRPKGYIEPTGPPLPLAIAATPSTSSMLIAPGGANGRVARSEKSSGPVGETPPTCALLLANILPISQLRKQEDREVLRQEVFDEASQHGKVEAVAVPPPPVTAQDRGPGRAYILYPSLEDSMKAKKIFHTRTLDESRIVARFVHPAEFESAARGEWVNRQNSVAGIPLPGLYTIGILSSGVSGLTALNPTVARANLHHCTGGRRRGAPD